MELSYILIVVIIVLAIIAGFFGVSYFSSGQEQARLVASNLDLNTNLNACSAIYVHDVNLLLNVGNVMFNHLTACYATAECLNDWNSCLDKTNINIYGNICLRTDQNVISMYNIFRKN